MVCFTSCSGSKSRLLLLLLHLLQIKMHAFLFLSGFVLAVTEYLLSAAHMIPEERLSSNRVVSAALPQSFEVVPPPVIIVGKVRVDAELPKRRTATDTNALNQRVSTCR